MWPHEVDKQRFVVATQLFTAKSLPKNQRLHTHPQLVLELILDRSQKRSLSQGRQLAIWKKCPDYARTSYQKATMWNPETQESSLDVSQDCHYRTCLKCSDRTACRKENFIKTSRALAGSLWLNLRPKVSAFNGLLPLEWTTQIGQLSVDLSVSFCLLKSEGFTWRPVHAEICSWEQILHRVVPLEWHGRPKVHKALPMQSASKTAKLHVCSTSGQVLAATLCDLSRFAKVKGRAQCSLHWARGMLLEPGWSTVLSQTSRIIDWGRG